MPAQPEPPPSFVRHVRMKLASALDYAGAVGVVLSFGIAIWLLLRGERDYLVFAAAVYTLGIAIFTKEDMWSEAYSYCRTGGPVAVMLALYGLAQRRLWLTIPMLLALPRIALQYMFVGNVTIHEIKVWLLGRSA